MFASGFGILFLFIFLDLGFIHGALQRIGWQAALALSNRLDYWVRRKIIDKLFGIHTQSAEWREPRFEGGVVDALGMKLLVNPIIDSDCEYLVNVAGARSESQAIERVKSLFLGI